MIMQMKGLIHCIYASRATAQFSVQDLPELLRAARAANAARDVTGMLLYIDGNFFQVLEGEQTVVDALFEHLSHDPRHTRVTRIIHEPIFERDFGNWTMGYAQLEVRELAQELGSNDFFSAASCLDELGPGRARKLLQSFRDGRWRAGDTGVFRAGSRVA
jgi:hypothetical protein